MAEVLQGSAEQAPAGIGGPPGHGEPERANEFVALLAHELRNPLAPIRNAVKILRMHGSPDPRLQWARDIIERQVARMERLIDDLVDLDRITRGQLELRRRRVALAEVLHEAAEASRPAIQARGHTLAVEPPEEEVPLDADPARLAQVFVNLLDNAAKFTPPGGAIEVQTHREGDAVTVEVADSGIGIAPEKLPRLFETFYQGEEPLEGRGGVGIGLSLVRHLVGMHGGTVEARSPGPGRGSTFAVRLPVASPALPAAAEADVGRVPGQTRRRTILVVDDNQDAADSLGLVLESGGHDVHIAYDGPTALELAAELRPEVVLLDIGIPGLNGYEVARRLRQEPWGAGAMLVALTGWGHDSDRARSEEAGFDHHLVKPVSDGVLEDLIG